MKLKFIAGLLCLAAIGSPIAAFAGVPWVDAVCQQYRAQTLRSPWDEWQDRFPVAADWLLQDAGTNVVQWFFTHEPHAQEQQLVKHALEQLGTDGARLREACQALMQRGKFTSQELLGLYHQACELRRAKRLATVLAKAPRIVFTKRHTILPSFFAYTEGQSDAQAERHFTPGAALCVLELRGLYGETQTLLSDPTGVIRDPAVSYDASKLLYAWKKSLNDDDYHLYEMNVATRQVRQLTSGLGFADYEGCYLPNGDIIFASTRCVQTVDCFWTEVSNLYACNRDGKYLRRLGVDQVHAMFPTTLDDGRVIYTRWDYNDRGQVFPQPLFQMNADGTGQTEFYGNNSWFPTTITHARGIPGTGKVVAIFCGHHTSQAGKLGIVDPSLGRQEATGAQLIAPVRETKPERIDAYGQTGELFQYPYPLNDSEFLVTYSPLGWNGRDRRKHQADFGIYYMDIQGNRELLVADAALPCVQPIPLAPRPLPPARPATVDYRKTNSFFYIQDIYAGPGLANVKRGTIKKLRVVALDFRAAGIGSNGSHGPGGGALISTPIAIGNGSWDVKVVLGETPVYADGSAAFEVPARTPVYFQAIDHQGHAAQTMRSWSTLQPGEVGSCVGCHEHKNAAPTVSPGLTLAQKAGPKQLEPFYGPPRGFSFAREIQPILNRQCVGCHQDREILAASWPTDRLPLRAELGRANTPNLTNAFSLLGTETADAHAKRKWSDAYLALTQAKPDKKPQRESFRGQIDGRWVNWIGSQSVVTMLPPYSAGSARSGLVKLLEDQHQGVKLTREELDKISCWIDLLVPYCADYQEANAWSAQEVEKYGHYLAKRRQMEALERQNIAEFIQAAKAPKAARAY